MESDTVQDLQIRETANLDELFHNSEMLREAVNYSKLMEYLSNEEEMAVRQAYADQKPFWDDLISQETRSEESILNGLAEEFLRTKHFFAPMFMVWARRIAQEFNDNLADSETRPKLVFLYRDGYIASRFVEFLIDHGLAGNLRREDVITLYLNRNTSPNDENVRRYVEEKCNLKGDDNHTFIVVDTGSNGSIVTQFRQFTPYGTRVHANLFLSNYTSIRGAHTLQAYFMQSDRYLPSLVQLEGLCLPKAFEGRYPYPEKPINFTDEGPVLTPLKDPRKTSRMSAASAAIEQYLREVAIGLTPIPDKDIASQTLYPRAVEYYF